MTFFRVTAVAKRKAIALHQQNPMTSVRETQSRDLTSEGLDNLSCDNTLEEQEM